MISLKPILNKALSLALVIILCLAPALSVGALAVNYPEGVTQADCEAAIPKLDKVIPAAVAMTGKSLDETFYGAVVTDAKAVTDGNFITGKGAGAAFEFGAEIVAALKGREVADKILAQMQY